MSPTTKLGFNPFSWEFNQDPYPLYAQLREKDPIHWSFLKAWVITRYDDLEFILQSPSFDVVDLPKHIHGKSVYLEQGDLYPLVKTIEKWLFFLKNPEHRRLRSLVGKAFAAVSLEQLKPLTEQRAQMLIDQVKSQGKMDAIKDFASPLSALTTTSILGIPEKDFGKLIDWSHSLSLVFDQPTSLEGYQKQNQVALEVKSYINELIAQKRENPDQGLISNLLEVSEQKDKLSEAEILSFFAMLLVVGQLPAESFIGNAILALAENPDRFREIQEHPEIINQAVEELFRYNSSIQVIARVATQDVAIRDCAKITFQFFN